MNKEVYKTKKYGSKSISRTGKTSLPMETRGWTSHDEVSLKLSIMLPCCYSWIQRWAEGMWHKTPKASAIGVKNDCKDG